MTVLVYMKTFWAVSGTLVSAITDALLRTEIYLEKWSDGACRILGKTPDVAKVLDI